MIKNLFLFICLLFVISSCKKSPYPGYSVKKGFYYKLVTIGEKTKKAKPGDYITVDIVYKTINDSVFFSGRRKFQLAKPAYLGSIDDCLSIVSEDDSCCFIISADLFFGKTLHSTLPSFINENSNMKINIKMLEIQTEKEYLKEKEAFLKWIEDFGEYEKVLLKHYIEEEQIDAFPSKSGLYYVKINEGRGKIVEKGDTVVVHYEGRFLNGKFFDSTKKRNEPFEFVYGQKWQVVEGIEEAIGHMQEGEKAIIILPSQIAFGDKGSSTGIIPPFTSLIFELELLQLRPAFN